MIKLKNGCKSRNLQEQVAWNAGEILNLKYTVGKAYIELDDTELTHTGTLTSDMKKVLDAYEIVYVILKQDDDLYQVFRTDYYEQKFRKCSILVAGSLHKLDLDYDNSSWSYSEQAIEEPLELVGSSGTLTTEQLTFLRNCESNYIKIKTSDGGATPKYTYELFRLNVDDSDNDNLVYTCMSKKVENSITLKVIKTISIVCSTKAWTLTSQDVKKMYLHKISFIEDFSNKNVILNYISSDPALINNITKLTQLFSNYNDTIVGHMIINNEYAKIYKLNYNSDTNEYEITAIYYNINFGKFESWNYMILSLSNISDTVTEL